MNLSPTARMTILKEQNAQIVKKKTEDKAKKGKYLIDNSTAKASIYSRLSSGILVRHR